MPTRRRWPVASALTVTALLAAQGSLGCGARPTASVVGGLGAQPADVGAERSAQDLDSLLARVSDSPETSLSGLTVQLEMEQESEGSEWTLDQVVGEIAPDANGRFAFDDVPVYDESDQGRYYVRIVQEPSALVKYGSGSAFRKLVEGERLELSLPLVTRLHLPLWPGDSEPGDASLAQPAVKLASDASGERLVYLSPHHGVGIYDPQAVTVDVLIFREELNFAASDARLAVVGATKAIAVSLVHLGNPGNPARFIVVDPTIFVDDLASELLDLDDPTTRATVGDRVFVLDLEADPEATPLPERDTSYTFQPTTVSTADGARVYFAENGQTFALDLVEPAIDAVWRDGGLLGAYNAVSGHLFFDMPDRTLRVRDAASGDVVIDHDVGALNLLGVVALGDEARTLVFYERDDAPGLLRALVLDAEAQIESDMLGDDYLGFTDRYWDPAYDWGTCTPEYFPEDYTPGFCVGGPCTSLHWLDFVYDVDRARLVSPSGRSFELRGGLFYPMPELHCGNFLWYDECNGPAVYDPVHEVALTQGITDPNLACVRPGYDVDLIVPVVIEADPDAFSLPAVAMLPHIGSGFIANSAALTTLHYRNEDAASLPAVRDMREAFE